MKPKKKRVIWAVEPIKDWYVTHDGLIYGIAFDSRKDASAYGKPVKFIEA